MRSHTADNLIIAALRDLDPALAADLTEAERERAEAAFARIVATPVEGSVLVEPGRPSRRRKRLLVGAGLVGAAGVTIPAVLLGGGGAYASWTPKPEPLMGGAAANAGATCRASIDAPDRGERVAVAERRGDWTFVLLAGEEAEAVCLMPDEAVGAGAGGRGDVFGAYTQGDVAPPPPGAETLVEGEAMSSNTSEGWFTWATGYVGSEVTGVTVHTSSGLDIEASVVGNRFAAWWPDDGQSWSYTVHLANGNTQRTS